MDSSMKLAYAFCGSFCTHKSSIKQLEKLAVSHEIVPILSEICVREDTRFGKAKDLYERVYYICGREPVVSIRESEDTITPEKFDALIVSPCTGNTLSKLANGITDSTVTMSVKAQLRNRKPVIIALATNDGLGANLLNIALTLEKKNIYYVPFGQDSPEEKPTSLICNFDKLEETLEHALKGRQLEPLIFS